MARDEWQDKIINTALLTPHLYLTPDDEVATRPSRNPAPDVTATVAPFRAWRGSQLIVARGPEQVAIGRALYMISPSCRVKAHLNTGIIRHL